MWRGPRQGPTLTSLNTLQEACVFTDMALEKQIVTAARLEPESQPQGARWPFDPLWTGGQGPCTGWSPWGELGPRAAPGCQPVSLPHVPSDHARSFLQLAFSECPVLAWPRGGENR